MKIRMIVSAVMIVLCCVAVSNKADAQRWRGYHHGWYGPRVGVRVWAPPVAVVAPPVVVVVVIMAADITALIIMAADIMAMDITDILTEEDTGTMAMGITGRKR